MQVEHQKAHKSWTDGGLQVGFDYGKALTLIYIVGLLNGLSTLLPKTPTFKEDVTENLRRVSMINWQGKMNVLQKVIYTFCRSLEKVFLDPLTRLSDRIIGPACGYFFAGIALIPGHYKGVRSNISLRHPEYHWAMDFVHNHAGKVVWSTIALSMMGLFAGLFLPFIMSSKVGIAAYFISMFLLPIVLTHLFLGFVAGGRGLWHLLSPLIPFARSENDRVRFTYHGAHRVKKAFADQPEVVQRLNAFFEQRVLELEEYTNQEALLVGQSRKEKKKIGTLPTVSILQREEDDFIKTLQKMEPAARLKAIEEKAAMSHRRLTW